MPGDKGGKTKHDRCVEGVQESNPAANPHAVCVAAGVEPASWKKDKKKDKKMKKSNWEGVGDCEDIMLKHNSNGQWSMEPLNKQMPMMDASSPTMNVAKEDGTLEDKMEPGHKKVQSDVGRMMEKDDAPHPPKSGEDSAHDVVEEGKQLQQEIKGLSSDKIKKLLEHLRQLKEMDKDDWKRSKENQEKGKD